MPKQGTERKVQAGGAPPKPFRTVDDEYRRRISNQVSAIRHAILPQVRRTGAAPVRAKLLAKAAAKSHRPEQLFSQSSCPIIGAGRLGELFVKATPEGLERLSIIIEKNTSDRVMKELSCVETIDPVTPGYRRKGLDPNEVLRRSPRGKEGFITRVRLFSSEPKRIRMKSSKISRVSAAAATFILIRAVIPPRASPTPPSAVPLRTLTHFRELSECAR